VAWLNGWLRDRRWQSFVTELVPEPQTTPFSREKGDNNRHHDHGRRHDSEGDENSALFASPWKHQTLRPAGADPLQALDSTVRHHRAQRHEGRQLARMAPLAYLISARRVR